MQFLNITNIIRFGIYLPLILISLNSQSQIARQNDAYSFYGIGSMYQSDFALNRSLGYSSTAYASSFNTNPINPASYSYLRLSSFEFGLDVEGYNLASDGESGSSSHLGISYMALAFPINTKWGLGFGLNPYSRVNYSNISERTNDQTGLETLVHSGSGGLSQARIGTSYRVKRFSGGFNFNFIFGNTERELIAVYQDIEGVSISSLSSTIPIIGDPKSAVKRYEKAQISGVGWDFGLQYHNKFKNKSNYSIGARTSLVSNMKSNNEISFERGIYQRSDQADLFSGLDLDTLYKTSNADIKLSNPNTFAIGFSIADSTQSRWQFLADFELATWSQFAVDGVKDEHFTDSYRISIGASLTPKFNALSSYFKKVNYRFGFYYNTGHLIIDDKKIADYGLTVGMGMPLSIKSFSRLNFSVDIGQKGSSAGSLVLESYLKTTIGFTFNDKWFIKRKYD